MSGKHLNLVARPPEAEQSAYAVARQARISEQLRNAARREHYRPPSVWARIEWSGVACVVIYLTVMLSVYALASRWDQIAGLIPKG